MPSLDRELSTQHLEQDSRHRPGDTDEGEMRRILVSSIIGTTVESYDFVLYATAASVVFADVFFADLNPAMATFAAMGTLATGYLARPLGAILFGHFGDRVSRKRMLVISIVIMGLATIAIGLLPTTAAIGVTAPIMLVALRIIQGVAMGGEWGGAMLMALEHSKKQNRGFAAGFAGMGGPAGAVLAALVLSAFSYLPDDQFNSWGWRIPFLLSAFLLAVGIFIRLRVSESPAFEQMEDNAKVARVPFVEVVRSHPRQLVIGSLISTAAFSCQGLMTVWVLSEFIKKGVHRTLLLDFKALAAVATMILIIMAARLSDKVGRRKITLAGTAAGIVATFPILWLVSVGTAWAYLIAAVLGSGVVMGLIYGPFGALSAELFPTQLRYTGASIVHQVGTTIGSGLVPTFAAGLVLAGGGSYWLVGIMWVVIFVLGAAATIANTERGTAELSSI